MQMKTIFILLAMTWAMVQCQQSLEKQVQDLHNQNQELAQSLKSTVDNLVSLRNSINIQGRLLTPEEISFTGKVNELEYSFREALRKLDSLQNMPLDAERLTEEQELNKVLTELKARADTIQLKRN